MPVDYETTEFERPVADRVLEPEVLTAFARERWRHRDRECRRCPLHENARSVCLFGNGTRRRSGLAIVADYPTEHDDRWGPFSTADVRWAYLATMLRDLDLDMAEVYRTYAVRCSPVEAEQVTRDAVQACQPYLLRELWEVRPSAILTLGAVAFHALTKGTGISKRRGQAVRWELPCACDGTCCSGTGSWQFLDEAGVTVHTPCSCGGACGAHEGHAVWLVPTLAPGDVLQRPSTHETFFADLAKWRRLGFGEDTTPEVEIVEVRSLGALRTAVEELRATHDKVLTFDLETRGFVDQRATYAKVWCAAFSTGHRGASGRRVFLVPLEHPESPWFPGGPIPARWSSYPEVAPVVGALHDLLVERALNGHNVKFDVRHTTGLFRRYGLATGGMRIGFDTILAAHTLDETREMNLLDQASTSLGVNDWGKGVQSFGLAEVDDLRELLTLKGKQGLSPLWGAEGMGYYCARDVAYCHLLYEHQRLKLREQPDSARLLRDLILPGVNGFATIELDGLWVDRARMAAADAELKRQHAEARALLIREHIDPELFAEWAARAAKGKKDVLANDHFLRAWLFTDPRGLQLEVVNRTKTGLPQVDEATLKLYDHPELSVLHDLRRASKFASFFEQWETWIGDDGRLHASFNLTGTVTGRRSCSNPNLQQVPRDRLVRSVIGAPPGWVFLEVDYSQLEVRLAAWIFGERNMLRIFEEGGDIYREAAARVLGKQPEEVTGDERQAAKVQVLGFIYGLSAPGFVLYAKSLYDLDFTVEESTAVRDAFFAAFPDLVYGHERARQEARKRWQVTSPDKRVRHLINILSMNGRERGKAERQAINCVDAETEALTRDGWRTHDRLAVGDEVLTKNPGTGTLEWQSVERLSVYPDYEGEVHHLRSRSFSAVVTPNHRWLVDRRARWDGEPSIEVVETRDLRLGGVDRIHRTGDYAGPAETLTDDEVRLLGWVLTDGHLKNQHGLGITQSERANPEKVAMIDEVVAGLHLPHSRASVGSFGAVVWHLHEAGARRYREMIPAKRLTRRVLDTLSGRQAGILLETMLLGDGSRDGSRWRLFAGDREQADAFAALAVLAGRSTSTTWIPGREVPKNYPSMGNRPISSGGWRVTVLNRDRAHVSGHRREVRTERRLMWCPTVPNGTFVARRAGVTYITGNSPIQGLGGDFTLASVVELTDRFQHARDRVRIVGDVHDALLFELRADTWREDAETILRVMESPAVMRNLTGGWPVKLIAEGKVGTHWKDADAKEFTLLGGGKLPSVREVVFP